MVSLPPSSSTSQNITLPDIPELFNESFLDVLLPKERVGHDVASARVIDTPKNSMMEALKQTANRTVTQNLAPALKSTLSATLDAFNGVSQSADGETITRYLSDAWKEDSQLTLRLIWCLRSIPDGKGSKETFYRAFGWLFDNHPRTAIQNLHLLVKPVSWKPKKKVNVAHGYWKDLLNIVALATTNMLAPEARWPLFLHHPREPYTYPRAKKAASKKGEAADRIAAHLAANAKRAEESKARRVAKHTLAHQRLTTKLSDPKFRALYIAVARLFAAELSSDISILNEISRLPAGRNPMPLLKTMSLAGKWAPTPGASHDRVTNLSSAICLLLARSLPADRLPEALGGNIDAREKLVILRSYYQRWVLRPLREVIQCPEPLMAANRWDEIRYNRVPSVCMKNNTELFFTRDPKRFEDYLVKVEEGKQSISGATLMPHELIVSILKNGALVNNPRSVARGVKSAALQEVKRKAVEMQLRAAESQWKALVENLRASGSLDNTLAICDVSGSMGWIHSPISAKGQPQPIQAAVALSLILASVAKPPFNGGFVTFSAHPQFVKLDLENKSIFETVNDMMQADWGMNTDFNAVFLKLLLPLAKQHNLKQEDMVKRLFVFSDMQFDEASSSGGDGGKWETNYDLIEKAYQEAGYEVPQIVYWDLNGHATKTVEVLGDRKGVAMMNGFSPSLLKVFMGEEEEGWEKVEGGMEDEFNPVNVMKKALMRKSFDGLAVLD